MTDTPMHTLLRSLKAHAIYPEQPEANEPIETQAMYEAPGVCEALGVHLSELVDLVPYECMPGMDEADLTAISPEGVLALALTSDEPIAREFRMWIEQTVMPIVFLSGIYTVEQEHTWVKAGKSEDFHILSFLAEKMTTSSGNLWIAYEVLRSILEGGAYVAIAGHVQYGVMTRGESAHLVKQGIAQFSRALAA
ncbi:MULTISPECIES: Bro-N domain-containing protein [unclassified Acidocella]|uniref:BRO-N domain-containing protein n=1 Tax=unclassified Acidocella TaxID=2648610 RepID=UPI00028D81C7|nr:MULTISPECIES: Bro-N domain-containing protein [unclassified Acidocella]EKN00802.1 hypothetical protein MXAZACID_03459 [Acidocella sp. MX-AZ02]WBO60342.1 Bro-N domain-containing protein [Acidocella sp. MX-AZ03]